MRALTIRQPYAWAIIAGHKDVENRDWQPAPWLLGQWVAIHAGAKVERAAIASVTALAGASPTIETGVIGVARLAQVVADYDSPWRTDSKWGFVFDGVRPIEPVPCRGALNFWRLPADIEGLVLERAFPEGFPASPQERESV